MGDDGGHFWTERDFAEADGVLALGDDVYFTIEAFARRSGLSVESIRDRVQRGRIPSIEGFADGCRLIPMSLIREALERRKRKSARTASTAEAEVGSLGSGPPITEKTRVARKLLDRFDR